MASLAENSNAKKWLKNFYNLEERDSAIDLINEILLVNWDDFVNGLNSLLDDIQSVSKHKVALYAERPINKVFGKTPSFFPNARNGRAEGRGVPPIVVDPRYQEVGSEGIVANIIKDYCVRNPRSSFSHPGPNKLRKEKVREIIILTDFIGSGQRVIQMLESFRYVATLRSWRSYHLIRFVVVAYSGTSEGIAVVRSHKLRPEVRIIMGCPTIQNTFTGQQRKRIEELCRSYPKGHRQPLGYRDSAALIAYAHGCPNNVPPILHSRKSGWKPLFEGRSTINVTDAFLRTDEKNIITQRAYHLLGIKDARKRLVQYEDNRWITTMLILAAAKSGLHSLEEISSRTHIEIESVNEFVLTAIKALWLDNNYRLTRLGHFELDRLRRRQQKKPVYVEVDVAGENNIFYYPTQLRVS